MKKEVYAYPPDYDKCQKHRLATRIFKGLEDDSQNEECECCGRRVGQEEVDTNCCFSNNQLAFLGPGLPLFFTYIKVAILIFVLLSCVFCLFAVISNILSDNCKDNDKCSGNIFDTLSIVNKINQESYLSVQNYVLLGFVVSFIVSMQYFRYLFRKINKECDEVTDSPSDYAAILRRLPQGTTEEDIVKLVEWRRQQLSAQEKLETDDLKIERIVMAFEMRTYLDKIEENKKKYKKSIKSHQEFIPEPLPTLDTPARLAVIIFSRQRSKDFFVYKPYLHQRILSCICDPCVPISDFYVKDQYVSIDRAPEPDDIKWENANISVSGAVWRKTFYTFISVCLLVGGAAAQYGLAVFQNSMKDERLIFYLGTASSLLVALMNQIILQFLYFASTQQRSETETQVNKGLTIRISFFMFMNAGVFIVAANILADLHNFTIEGNFSNEVTQIMILNAITPNLSLIGFDYFDIEGRVKRWLFLKRKFVFLQIQANRLYQLPAASLPYKYGYVVRTLWLTAFYCPLVPIVVPISALGLLINYWIEKCLHAKSYRSPSMVSSMVNETATQLLQYIPLIMSVGEFLIYLDFLNFRFDLVPVYWAVPIYISLGLSVLNVLMPLQALNKRYCFLEAAQDVNEEYQKVEEQFDVTYEMLNPAYVCNRKRKRDKMLLRSIFGKMDELTNLNSRENTAHMKDALLSPLMQHNQGYINQPQRGSQSNEQGHPVNPALLLFQPHAHYNPYGPQQNQSKGEQERNLFDVLLKKQQVFTGFNNDRYV